MNPRKKNTDIDIAFSNDRTACHFSLVNSKGNPYYRNLPILLRSMADRIDELGDDAIVRDLRFELDEYVDDPLYNPEEEELTPSLTVFYSRQTEGSWAANSQKATTDDYTKSYFSTTLHQVGSGSCGVPDLLRGVAGRLDERQDDFVVSDLILHSESTDEGASHSANTYRFKEYTDD
jgi:hypothetical protein